MYSIGQLRINIVIPGMCYYSIMIIAACKDGCECLDLFFFSFFNSFYLDNRKIHLKRNKIIIFQSLSLIQSLGLIDAHSHTRSRVFVFYCVSMQ